MTFFGMRWSLKIRLLYTTVCERVAIGKFCSWCWFCVVFIFFLFSISSNSTTSFLNFKICHRYSTWTQPLGYITISHLFNQFIHTLIGAFSIVWKFCWMFCVTSRDHVILSLTSQSTCAANTIFLFSSLGGHSRGSVYCLQDSGRDILTHFHAIDYH